eukprot:EC721897.1.p3 GENE.EC721897.1~~EC721897.1.p3  ORF type:complete len:63 (-),score=1.94 EC721897.1:262-450(-)
MRMTKSSVIAPSKSRVPDTCLVGGAKSVIGAPTLPADSPMDRSASRLRSERTRCKAAILRVT